MVIGNDGIVVALGSIVIAVTICNNGIVATLGSIVTAVTIGS